MVDPVEALHVDQALYLRLSLPHEQQPDVAAVDPLVMTPEIRSSMLADLPGAKAVQ